jgi:hypothetical protein
MKFCVANSSCHARVLIATAVFSLTMNVATRYCFMAGAETHMIKRVMSHSPNGERQRLLSDGSHWVAPAANFRLFEPRPARRIGTRNVSPITDLYSETCLYNRPPPTSQFGLHKRARAETGFSPDS